MARDKRHTEFGGGPGSIGRLPDGSDKTLSVGERARIARIVGMRGDLPSVTEARTQRVAEYSERLGRFIQVDRPYQPDVDAIAALRERTNNYSDNADSIAETAPGLDN